MKITVEIKDGNVQRVSSNTETELEILVVDYDNYDTSSPRHKELDDEDCTLQSFIPDENPFFVEKVSEMSEELSDFL